MAGDASHGGYNADFCAVLGQFQKKLEGNGPTDERAAMIVVSEANFDLRFEISNLNYSGTYVHDVSNSHLGGL